MPGYYIIRIALNALLKIMENGDGKIQLYQATTREDKII